MTKNALVHAKDMDSEMALARADELLKIWQLPEDAPADALRAARDACAAALQSGEARMLAESIGAGMPEKELVMTVGEMIGSFPPRPGQDLQIFTRMMVLDVIRAAPSRAALDAACRSLRASCTFLPSIKEVLDAVEAQKAACASRAALLERLPRRIAELDRANNSGADAE